MCVFLLSDLVWGFNCEQSAGLALHKLRIPGEGRKGTDRETAETTQCGVAVSFPEEAALS